MAKKLIPWEYCECGCHGCSVHLGSFWYWLYNDLKGKTPYHLYIDHGPNENRKIGRYKSLGVVDAAVRRHAKPRLAKLRKELESAEALLA